MRTEGGWFLALVPALYQPDERRREEIRFLLS